MFRIDKSFVESMELNKEVVVIANKQAQEEKPKREDIKQSASMADIGEEITKKAGEQAEKIISEAEVRASALGEAAKKDGYCDGYRDGYAEGRRLADGELEALIQSQTEDLKSVFDKLETYKKDLYEGLLSNVLELSLDIAEKIVNINLEKDDSVYREIAKKAISSLESKSKITLRVSPREYERFFGEGDRSLSKEIGHPPFEVICDQLMESGDCIAESDDEVVNTGINEQFEKLKSELGQRTAT